VQGEMYQIQRDARGRDGVTFLSGKVFLVTH